MSSQGIDTITLKVGADPVIPANAPFKTDGKKITRSNEWSIILTKTGTDGDPLVEVEGANNNVDAEFVNAYEDPNSPGTPLVLTMDLALNAIRDQDFPFQFFRLNGVPNGTTVGTLGVELTLAQDT